MEFAVNVIPFQVLNDVQFIFKYSQACIVVGLGSYSIVYYEVVSVFSYTFVFRRLPLPQLVRDLAMTTNPWKWEWEWEWLSLKICNPLNFKSPTTTNHSNEKYYVSEPTIMFIMFTACSLPLLTRHQLALRKRMLQHTECLLLFG